VYLGLLRRGLAAAHFRKAIDLQPANARAYLGLATSQRGLRQYADAVATLREGLRAAPGSLPLLNLLARTLATCPEEGVRDGAAAVRAAEQATRGSTVEHRYEVMDTLAAAYAEAGRWSDAIDAAGAAVEAARNERSTASAAILGHLEQYRRREPLREFPLEEARRATSRRP
jgi:tetratricopeptide (TPR) repeat protein